MSERTTVIPSALARGLPEFHTYFSVRMRLARIEVAARLDEGAAHFGFAAEMIDVPLDSLKAGEEK